MRLAQGWVKMPVPMLRALLAGVGGVQGVILTAVLEESWFAPMLERHQPEHVPRPSPCLLSLAKLSRRTGIGASTLSTAKRLLIERRYLIEHPDGGLELNADFTEWKARPKEQAKQWESLIDYFSAAATFVGACRTGLREPLTRSGSPGKADGRLEHRKPRRYEPPPESSRQRDDLAGKSSRQRDDSRLPSYRKKISEEREVENSRPLAQEAFDDKEPEEPFHAKPTSIGPPSFRRQAAGKDGSLDGDVVPDEQLLERIRLFVDRFYAGNALIHANIRLFKRQVPTAWFLKALKRLVAQGKHDRATWAYVWTIINDWFDVGVTRGPEDDFGDDMRRLKPSERKAVPAAPGKPVDNPPSATIIRISDEQRRWAQAAYAAMESPPPEPLPEGEGPLFDIERRLKRLGKFGGGTANAR